MVRVAGLITSSNLVGLIATANVGTVTPTVKRFPTILAETDHRYPRACSAYSSAYAPGEAISSACVPTSLTRSSASTTTRPAAATVENRWGDQHGDRAPMP